MNMCYWCEEAPPCPHRSTESAEEGLLELRAAVNQQRGPYPSRREQLKIRWVRWFHVPVMPERRWCNCGRPYPCRTRMEVIG